jgi:replication factor A1
LNQKKPTIIEHLAFLSVKHGVYLSELFQALVLARENGKSVCMDLKVQYRGSMKKEAIFLITKFNKVVVQFRAAEDFLRRKDNHFESWLNTDRIRKQMSRRTYGASNSTMVQDLRHGMKKVNVEAEVLETPKQSLVRTRYGNNATITNISVADETGRVKLCLWNTQANQFTVGDTIQIRNASVLTFRSERQLHIGKTGTISLLQSRAVSTKQQPEAIATNTIYA